MHARLGRFNAILLAAALARAAFETLDALEEVTNLASVTREVSDVFDTIGGPDLGTCAVDVFSITAIEGASKVEDLGLKLIDAIAVESFVFAMLVVASEVVAKVEAKAD